MKKFFSFLLVLTALLSLCACGDSYDSNMSKADREIGTAAVSSVAERYGVDLTCRDYTWVNRETNSLCFIFYSEGFESLSLEQQLALLDDLNGITIDFKNLVGTYTLKEDKIMILTETSWYAVIRYNGYSNTLEYYDIANMGSAGGSLITFQVRNTEKFPVQSYYYFVFDPQYQVCKGLTRVQYNGTVTCPSCGKQVSKLYTRQDAAGVYRTWCSDCWQDYDDIMG